jgi:hypothetical protein
MKFRVMLKHKLEALCIKVHDASPPPPRMLEVLYHISKQIIEGVKDGVGWGTPTKVCTQSPLCF